MHQKLLDHMMSGGTANIEDNPEVRSQLLFLSKADPEVRVSLRVLLVRQA